MSKELKPCPFCGSKAFVCKPLEEITGWVIRCEKGECCEMGVGPTKNKDIHLKQLIKAWNRRRE